MVGPSATGSRAQPELRVNPGRIESRIRELAQFGKTSEGGVSRVAFSDEDIQGRSYVIGLMREAGLEVSVDAAGNIIGKRPGARSGLAPIMFGSHIDSVPHGGIYDGALGVIGAIECILALAENKITTRHPLEVVVFSDEEGGLVGSRALIGELRETALEVVSYSSKTIRDGIRVIGGDPSRLSDVILKKGDVAAFVELHIEQGSVLEEEEVEIGVVEGIVGIQWWDVTIEGFANHAGTTPMNRRKDSLLAASRLVQAVHRIVTEVPGNQVGTVGRISAEPGAANIIPGRVLMSMEIRDMDSEKIERLYRRIENEAAAIASSSGTRISFTRLDVAAVPALTDRRVQDAIVASACDLQLRLLRLPSWAGHDAQNMARITPTGMIFVPSIGGVSHSPKEKTLPQDTTNGCNVLLHTILKLDQSELSRDSRSARRSPSP